jgi:3-phenylpropionate/trans-cinnamate dioxygenase ferredoxin component
VSEYKKVCRLDALPESKPYTTDVDDYEIILVRQGDKVYCLLDQCSHEDFPLSHGIVDGCKIRCKAHGAEFDLASGKVLKAPALVGVKTFPVKVEDGDVWVAV